MFWSPKKRKASQQLLSMFCFFASLLLFCFWFSKATAGLIRNLGDQGKFHLMYGRYLYPLLTCCDSYFLLFPINTKQWLLNWFSPPFSKKSPQHRRSMTHVIFLISISLTLSFFTVCSQFHGKNGNWIIIKGKLQNHE